MIICDLSLHCLIYSCSRNRSKRSHPSTVFSGMRRDVNILIFLDVKRALQGTCIENILQKEILK